MGKKINIVNLNGFENATPAQPTNEAEELSKIKDDIQKEEPPKEPEELPPVQQEAEPKAKPKRRPRAKKKTEEIITPPPSTPVEDKPVEEKPEEEIPPKPEKKIKTVELVSCPHCKKEMSKKTLRYSHEKNCTGKPIVREEIPVKRRPPPKVKQEATPQTKDKYISIPEEVVQQEINRRVKEQKESRIRAKDERIKKLATRTV
jgi:hypothetical protein